MLKFDFQPEKALQAAGVVLRYHGKQVGMMRLLKILYIADRELLAATGRTLTGDRAVAMVNGPVLSRTYNYAKQQADGSQSWGQVIERNGYRLTLTGDIGLGKLSRREVGKLQEVCERYHDVEDFDLSNLTHKFAEWDKAFDRTNPKSSFPIDWELALSDQGKADMIDVAKQEAEVARALTAAFGR